MNHETRELPSRVGPWNTPSSRYSYYIAFELATGGELFDRIAHRGKFTEKDAIECIRCVPLVLLPTLVRLLTPLSQVLLGTAYLHANRIVHRDLKPENIIYKTKALDSPLVIADFGIAKSLEDVAAAAEVARSRESSPTAEQAGAGPSVTPEAGPSTAPAQASPSSTPSPVRSGPAPLAEEGEELKCMAGSFGYIAPEVLMGTGHGMKVDMWSIG